MDVKDIELIRAVHEEASISKASVRLNLSQPTVSKKLARLEQVLGATLFQRYPKGLVATETAKYIITKSAALRSQIAEIERHVELMNQLDSGLLRLGVGPIIEQLMLPKVLESFTQSTGGVQLSIVTENDDTLLAMLDASELDVVVGPFRVDEHISDRMMAIPMIEDTIIAVVRQGHPILQGKPGEEADLLGYDWVSPKSQGTARVESDHPILKKMKVLSDNYNVLKNLTLHSDVICAGPSAIFREELQQGVLARLDFPPYVNWQSALLVRPETYATPLGKHLVSLFVSAKESNTES